MKHLLCADQPRPDHHSSQLKKSTTAWWTRVSRHLQKVKIRPTIRRKVRASRASILTVLLHHTFGLSFWRSSSHSLRIDQMRTRSSVKLCCSCSRFQDLLMSARRSLEELVKSFQTMPQSSRRFLWRSCNGGCMPRSLIRLSQRQWAKATKRRSQNSRKT